MSKNKAILSMVESYFKKKHTNKEVFLNLALLVFKKESGEKNIQSIPDVIGVDSFIKLIEFTDGKGIKTPSKETLRVNLFTILLYYMKHIEGKGWSEIAKEVSIHDYNITSDKMTMIRRKVNEFDIDFKMGLSTLNSSEDAKKEITRLIHQLGVGEKNE